MAHIAIGEAEGFAWLESVIGPGARIGSAEELVPEAEGEGPGILPVAVPQRYRMVGKSHRRR